MARTRPWPAGARPEPLGRVIGEEQVVTAADRLVANTADETHELVDLYGADPGRVSVVPPGVDLDVFDPRAPGGRAGPRRPPRPPPCGAVPVSVGPVPPPQG